MMNDVVFSGNIFEYAKNQNKTGENIAVAVTTNGILRMNGYAVMGAGIAKYAKEHLHIANLTMLKSITGMEFLEENNTIDYVLGKMLKLHGNHAFYLGLWYDDVTDFTCGIVTMPTKWDWREDSDVDLIARSADEMMTAKLVNNLTNVYLPAPGCSNGKLSFSDVKPVISKILDDKFTCVHPKF